MKSTPWHIVRTVRLRLANPAFALVGALVLVQLMIMMSGTSAPVSILELFWRIGYKKALSLFSFNRCTLGSFFSGSTTVSNLTFDDIQDIAASSIGVDITAMLALPTVS